MTNGQKSMKAGISRCYAPPFMLMYRSMSGCRRLPQPRNHLERINSFFYADFAVFVDVQNGTRSR